MATEAAVRWERRRPPSLSCGGTTRRSAVRSAGVAVAVLIAVVALSYYAAWGGDPFPTPDATQVTVGSNADDADSMKRGGRRRTGLPRTSSASSRKHEALQKRCGPGTKPYMKALRQLKSGDGGTGTAGDGDCRYVVSVGYDRGLGNRILAIVSAFLYAVLTERALLVAPYGGDVAALFCEPFPGTTWLLPGGRRFPLRRRFSKLNGKSRESFGTLLKSDVVSGGGNGTASWSGGRPPTHVYLHLDGSADFHDKLFYCDEQQGLLHGVPWLSMKTDSYLAPGLFLLPSLQGELDRMFPDKNAPSHEGRQRSEDAAHDMRALSEMYLLSTCDVLLTTGVSTFGYVAQGLAGVRPWLMPRRPWWEKQPASEVPEPPCVRVASPEPCFHSPSYYSCAARRDYDDIGKVVPYVQRCEDISWGIQLVNGSSQW
uniref:Fucosyltransferase n=1 Tax=Oryza brachyantha TaxID=4533 RepID=J3LBQ4_ORYBR